MDGQEEKFSSSFSPSFFPPTGGSWMVRWLHHSSSPSALLIEAAVTGTKKNSRRKKTRVASVSCGLCSCFSESTHTTQAQHLVTEQAIKQEESHRKTITHQALVTTVLFIIRMNASIHLFCCHNQTQRSKIKVFTSPLQAFHSVGLQQIPVTSALSLCVQCFLISYQLISNHYNTGLHP